MVADHETMSLTTGPHPMALLRPSLPATIRTSRDLLTDPSGETVTIAGITVARQRPSTAKGIVFLLLEDEFGTINLIVPPPVYDAHRLIVRSEPLILAEGRLEKLPMAGGGINVSVHRLRALDAPEGELADVVDLAARTAAAAAAEGPDRQLAPAAAAVAGGGDGGNAIADFRGVAPPVQSFASGRRR
jgi:error-prone DNA polymerase